MNYIYSARDPLLPSLLCAVIYSPRAKSQEALAACSSRQVAAAATASVPPVPPARPGDATAPPRDLLPAQPDAHGRCFTSK